MRASRPQPLCPISSSIVSPSGWETRQHSHGRQRRPTNWRIEHRGQDSLLLLSSCAPAKVDAAGEGSVTLAATRIASSDLHALSIAKASELIRRKALSPLQLTRALIPPAPLLDP